MYRYSEKGAFGSFSYPTDFKKIAGIVFGLNTNYILRRLPVSERYRRCRTVGRRAHAICLSADHAAGPAWLDRSSIAGAAVMTSATVILSSAAIDDDNNNIIIFITIFSGPFSFSRTGMTWSGEYSLTITIGRH